MSFRTFLAVELPERLRGRMAKLSREWGTFDGAVRWVPPRNLHVTLIFLGELQSDRLGRVCELAERATQGQGAFELSLAGLRALPSRGAVRVIWAEVQDPAGRLGQLHDTVEEALLRGEGIVPGDRAYRPHVTLGRCGRSRRGTDRAIRDALAGRAEQAWGRFAVEELVVFTSELTPGGPIYTPAVRCPLAV